MIQSMNPAAIRPANSGTFGLADWCNDQKTGNAAARQIRNLTMPNHRG